MRKKAGGNTATTGDLYDSLKGTFNNPGSQAVVGAVVVHGATMDEMNYGLPLTGPVPENKAAESRWETVNVGKAPRPKH